MKILALTMITIIALSLIAVLGLALYSPFDRDDYSVTVVEKGVKRHNSSDRYLIYTDQGTFEMTDSLVHFRYDTSDEYAKIKVGKTYAVVTYGLRIPFFSMYENILEFEELNSSLTE